MLDRLPCELIENITSNLDNTQVINSMTTCRTWHDLLQFYITKNELTIRNHEQLKQITHNINAKKLDPKYIRKVYMKRPFYNCTEMKQLPILFPNLQQLVGESPPGCYKQLLYNPESINLGHLSSALRHLHLERLGFFTIELLQKFTFPCLAHLLLDFMGASYSAKEILSPLKNFTSLESLELVSLVFESTTMEELHRNIPTLKTLVLVDVAMMFESGLPVYKMEPAPNLQSLHIIGDSVAYDDHLYYIKYITLKYPCMNDLVLDMLYFQDLYFQDDYDPQIYALCQKAILQLIDSLPRILKTLRLQILPLKKQVLDHLDSKKVKETVLFRDNPFSDAVSVTEFFKSETAKAVETLWILGYSALEIQSNRIESRLTTLYIQNISIEYNAPLNIDQLLSLHPKLKELCIEDDGIDIACDLICSLKSLPLKSLRLVGGNISNNLPRFIHRFIPHLTRLSLLWANCYSVTHIHLHLPQHQLQRVEIQNNRTYFNCAIKTDLGMKRYNYWEHKTKNKRIKQTALLYNGTSRNHPENDAIVIACKSIWNLVVNSKRVI